MNIKRRLSKMEDKVMYLRIQSILPRDFRITGWICDFTVGKGSGIRVMWYPDGSAHRKATDSDGRPFGRWERYPEADIRM